jgi:hypothetical protein
MENEVNVNEQTPATPEVELTSTAPETPENTSVNNNTFPELSAADLEKLSPVEQDLYLDAKEMNPAEIAVMPPNVRKDIENLRNKLTAPATAETAAAPATVDDAPKSDVKEADVTQADDAVTAPAETPAEKSEADRTDEIIRRLTEENRKLQARYDTLQGKYNAEVKKPKESASGSSANNGGDESADAPAVDEDAYAEELGLDADIIRAIRRVVKDTNVGNSGKDDSALSAQVAELYAHRQNTLLDAAIRARCGNGIGLHEAGTHPLLPGYASERVNENGGNAWDDFNAAKDRHDHAAAAAIISQVVKAMEKDGMWNLNRRHSAQSTAEPAVNSAAPQNGSTATVNEKSPSAQAVKPSAIVPHNISGVTMNSLHTGRTAAQAKQEYAALHKRFLGGDSSVLPRMNQLDDEITRLEIKEKFK